MDSQKKFEDLTEIELQSLQQEINEQKKSIRECAKLFNLHHTTFSDKMTKKGYPLNPQKAGRKPNKISEETKKLVLDAKMNYNLGATKLHQK